MTIAPDTTQGSAEWPELRQRRRAIVVVDVVESVRLMQANEADVIDRWRHFVNVVRTQVLPRHGGRLVKSLGDGLLLEFETVPAAAAAALEIQASVAPFNSGRDPDAWINLRVGAHLADVVVDELDVYGSGVNLAARLATLAGPSEIVVSADVRDQLVVGLDANLEDLGECYVKHLDAPVRAFRIGAAGPNPVLAAVRHSPPADLRAVVAIVPFQYRGDPAQRELDSVGELIADGVIALLSGSPSLRLVSRMSSSVFRSRATGREDVARLLGASYVLSGSYHCIDHKLVVMAELSDVRKRDTVWAERLVGDVDDLLQEQSELLGRLAATLHREILSAEVMATLLQPPPSLQSYSLQIGGVSLMHRSGGRDFERVRDVFEHLIERHPRLAAPRAWLAKWYVLRVTRGIVDDVAAEAAIAMEHTRRALDMDPTCSLALAMQGFVKCHMLRDLDGAMTTFNQALDMNPSDSLAWLFKGVVHSFWGEGEPALAAVVEALRLSPLDPLRHYYDGLAAPAALAAGRYELAVEFAERSLRVNRLHSPTLRALAIAQSELGQMEAARATVKQLLVLEPGLSERSYLQRSPAGANETRVAYARALRRAGVPAG